MGPGPGGAFTKLNISTSTVIKADPGTLVSFVVTTAGAVGSIHDCALVGDITAANLVAVVPATVGPVTLNWTCKVGIVYIPGAAQVANFGYSN